MEQAILLTAILMFGFGLFSKVAARSPITAPMVFVTVGILVSPLCLGLFELKVNHHVTEVLATLTLILVLFFGACKIDLRLLLTQYKIPVRLLFIGLPLTMVFGTLIAFKFFPDMNPWLAAVMALILSPTDAALGEAVVTMKSIPQKTRDSIAVESGLNDGISLPPILACIAALSVTSGDSLDVGHWTHFAVSQLVWGPIIGGAIGWVGGSLIERAYQKGWMNMTFVKLAAVALAIMAYAAAGLLDGNGFIAAFFGGLMVGTRLKETRPGVEEFGDSEGQQLILFVFLIFGLALVPFVAHLWDGTALLYALTSLTIIRIVPVAISLFRTTTDWATVGFIGWFGPRGIASILYLFMFVSALGIEGHEQMLSVIILTVLLSVFLHGLSAVPLSKLYAKHSTG